VPDTVYVEQATDSTARIVQEFTFPDGAQEVRKSPEMDSTAISAALVRTIYRNEERLNKAIRGISESQGLNPLYPVINSLLQTYAGSGYLPIQRQRTGGRFVGVYRVTFNASVIFMSLREDGVAIQINSDGTPVVGGYLGTWGPATEESFILSNFLPTNVLPPSERIVSRENGNNEFFTLNTVLEFQWLRAQP